MSRPPPDPGLCRTCVDAKPVTSAKGSTFWRCGRHDREPRFPKYPPLPVVRCVGYSSAPT